MGLILMFKYSSILVLCSMGLLACTSGQYSQVANRNFQVKNHDNNQVITVVRDEKLCAGDTLEAQNCPINFYIDSILAGSFYVNNSTQYYLKSESYNFKVKNCTEAECQSCDIDLDATSLKDPKFILSVDENGKPLILNSGNPLVCPTQQPNTSPVQNPTTVQIQLAADTLFKFNGSALSDLNQKGHDEIVDLSSKINSGYASVSAIKLVGHTDRLGSESYNKKLGLERANTVRQLLVQNGISENIITASSAGESQPVTDGCQGVQPKSALTSCLQPDRRVTVEITGITK